MMRLKLQRAGRRHRHAESAFLLTRAASALGITAVTVVYLLVLAPARPPLLMVAGAAAIAMWLGVKLPVFTLERAAQTRAASIRSAWPDALDLMVIMLETGRPIEPTWRRVAEDIAPRSQALAEELNITLMELSFLPERRKAYENFGQRVDIREVRSACMAISQAEEQGTAIAATLRAIARDGRAARIASAEEKAGKAATYATLPLVLFYLPTLAVLVTAPSLIAFMHWN
ncbi:type II secretion system F family protein [Xanthobacter sp. V13C-7B]|uniref:type II secretion system F family protein n=1 Tax=Xanthobacter variabilis TaxID=3119932 RepID=UPI0037274231